MSRQEDAARWFAARRRGVMSVEERAAFDAWSAAPDNRSALRQMENIWAAVGDLGGIERTPRKRNATVFAAMCVACVALGILTVETGSPFWTTLDWSDR